MKHIALSGKRGKGKFALVDDEDYEVLNQWKWILGKSGGYPVRSFWAIETKQRVGLKMHQFLLGSSAGFDTDHIDRNKLNNQKSNLRICTRSQNSMNKIPRKNKSSVYKGVYWHNQSKGWRAKITVNGKTMHLRNFKEEKEAANAYNKAAIELHGEFRVLNKI